MNLFNSNFAFLSKDFPLLANLAASAESYFHADPSVSMTKLRAFGEKLTDILFKENRLYLPQTNTYDNRIKDLKYADCITSTVADLLHIIRLKGNAAAHEPTKATHKDAELALDSAFKVAKWLYDVYATEPDEAVQKLVFALPPKFDAKKIIADLAAKQTILEEQLAKVSSEKAVLSKSVEAKNEADAAFKKFSERVKKASARIELSEAQTRQIIDNQLRKAGWEVDTATLNFKTHKTLPQDGRFMAIAEWYCGNLWADYALFVGQKLVGLVEAKKKNLDVAAALTQAKTYAQTITPDNLQFWDAEQAYKVPFLFSTNGRPYNAQILTKSGVWFYDTRLPNNISRALQGWFSPQGLLDMLGVDTEGANARLQTNPLDYLTDKRGLGLRPYQIQAIQSVENQIIRADTEGAKRRALVAMATGTGKTRTILGLCYRLLETKRFRRILFLVDRNVLGKQSKTIFEETVVDQLQPFGKIYTLAGFEDNSKEFETQLKGQGKADDATKIYFSSVQGMVHRIFNNTNAQDMLPIHAYDCIIVDEAHRGYLLDKELDDSQLSFRDNADFVSKYKAVLDYFDAFRIGLTATPALHTSEIFGFPVFNYSYRKAVLEGYLVDYEPPFIIQTKLNQEGIEWKKGEKPKMMDENGKIIELAALADDLKIDVEGFNRNVVTAAFNQTVCAELVQHLDIDSEAKTLIFAVNNTHADIIVDELKKAFIAKSIDIQEDTILKITGAVYQNEQLIKRYKNENEPKIVVTVDLLTTGIDIPKISNLVFLRRVNSRILYDQMLGRATRLCPEIGKDVFHVFDAVRLSEALSEFTDMKPIAQNPNLTITELAADLAAADNDSGFETMQAEIAAKLRRKCQLFDTEYRELFAKIAKGETPESFVAKFQALSRAETPQYLEQNLRLLQFFEGLEKEQKKGTLYSEHADEHLDTFQDYGNNVYVPQDYLETFKRHLTENINKNAALNIIATKPQTLTRAELKALKADLDDAGFSLVRLQTALKKTSSEDITADIIAIIRTLTLGDPLIPKEERISKAMKRVMASQKWSVAQRGWLDRIEKRLKQEEPLIDVSFINEDALLRLGGGFNRMNAIFDNQGEAVLTLINEQLYAQSA